MKVAEKQVSLTGTAAGDIRTLVLGPMPDGRIAIVPLLDANSLGDDEASKDTIAAGITRVIREEGFPRAALLTWGGADGQRETVIVTIADSDTVEMHIGTIGSDAAGAVSQWRSYSSADAELSGRYVDAVVEGVRGRGKRTSGRRSWKDIFRH